MGSVRLSTSRQRLAASALVLAATVAAPTGGCKDSPESCPAGSCEAEVYAYSTLDVPLEQPVQLHVRACNNGQCGEASISSNNTGASYTLENGSQSVDLTLDDGSQYGLLHGSPGPGDQWVLTVEYRWTGTARNDDLIEITVTDEDTGGISEFSRAVIYHTYEPVADCELRCKETSFQFPPP
jgi:hypothetical protein